MGTTAAGTAVARKLDSVEALSAELREHTLLEAAQANELPSLVQAAGRDVNRLTQELLRRGWLTPWQAGQVLAGRAAQLSFGPYLLTDRLGEGGAGQVFQARHRRMRRRVALKLIRPEVLQDAELVARFEREIQVASRLSHPNVIHAYDAGTVGATRFLALEYAEGIDLDRLLKQSGPLPVERACDYIRQGALGLHHAFEHGLVHRDVKPSNFLLVQGQAKAEVPGYEDSAPAIPSPGPTPWGLVKLLDLGLARLQRKVDGEKTR
ncbi:MAG: serine/threonine protein kinase, partial [Planctomycetia bacterium]|nr:serine/threonine protein kinase [Planctomycetia bacterium]